MNHKSITPFWIVNFLLILSLLYCFQLKNKADNLKKLLFSREEEEIEKQEIIAENLMMPREEVVFLSSDSSQLEIIMSFINNKQEVIPICQGDSIDKIVGNIDVYSLLESLHQGTPVKLLEKQDSIVYVPSNAEANFIAKILSNPQTPLIAVVDEFGATVGIITNNVLVKNLGDQWKDNWEGWLGDSILVDAKTYISDLKMFIPIKEEMNLDSESTIGGFLLEYLNRVPQKGEEINVGDLLITIVEADIKRIKKIAIKKVK